MYHNATSWPVFCWGRYPGRFWFRIFGVGFSIRSEREWPLLFSERDGHTRVLVIRGVVLKGLWR